MAVQPASHAGRSTLKAVLFDIDGTLFNSDEIHLAVFQEMLQAQGFNGGDRIDKRFFLERISGRQNARIVADLFPEWGVEEGSAFSERKEARFRELAVDRLAELITPGLPTFLDFLAARGVACAAVTNAPRPNALLMLRAIGRDDFFHPLVIGDECSNAKPHPEPYLAAMRVLGVDPESCLAFEDSPSGARAAVGAGVRTLGITSTQPEAALAEAGCAVMISDFESAQLWQELRRWQLDEQELVTFN